MYICIYILLSSKPDDDTREPFFKNVVVLGNIMYKKVLSKLTSAKVSKVKYKPYIIEATWDKFNETQ